MGLFGNGNQNPAPKVFGIETSKMVVKGKAHYILPGPELLSTWYGVKHTVQSSYVLHYELGTDSLVVYLSKTENHEDLPDAGRFSFAYAVFPDTKKNFLIVWADQVSKIVTPSDPAFAVAIMKDPQEFCPHLAKVTFPGQENLGHRLAKKELPISTVYVVQSRSFISEVVCAAMLGGNGSHLSAREIMLNKLSSMSSERTYSKSDLEALGIKPQNVNIAIENLKFPVLDEIDRGTFVFYAHTLQRYLRAAAEREAEEQGFRDKHVNMRGTDGQMYRLGANENGVIDGSVAEVVKEGAE